MSLSAALQLKHLEDQVLTGRAFLTLSEEEEDILLEQMDKLWPELSSDEKEEANQRAYRCATIKAPVDLHLEDQLVVLGSTRRPRIDISHEDPMTHSTVSSKAFYIACSVSNWRLHNALRDRLEVAGHQITHDWTAFNPWFKDPSDGKSGEKARAEASTIREAGLLDLQGIRDADVVIVLLPAKRGSHTELGAALMAGKHVLLHGTEEDIWSTESDYTCAFYHVPSVIHCTSSWDDFLEQAPQVLHELPKPAPGLSLGLDVMAAAAYDNARRKGFWGDPEAPGDCNLGERLFLMVTELVEAFEEWREGDVDLTTITTDVDGKPGKPGGFPTELADVIIRIGDLAGRYGIPLDEAMQKKMTYNLGRPWMHGGKKC
jgi:hypothetical protein